LFTSARLAAEKLCVERAAVPDCGGLNDPGRFDCTDAGAFARAEFIGCDGLCDPGLSNELPFRLPLKPDCGRDVGFAPEKDRGADPFALLVRAVPLKKCCELGGALRNADGFAARPDGLKLSRDGVIGILPLTMLVWRKAASLIAGP